MKPFHYDLPILPEGFLLPEEYRRLSSGDSLPDIRPWTLLSQNMAASLSYYGAMLQKFPERPLIPFAILDDQSGFYNDGWVVLACFDGLNHSGNPEVLIYDYSRPVPPWDNLIHNDFSAWLKDAQAEAKQFEEAQIETSIDTLIQDAPQATDHRDSRNAWMDILRMLHRLLRRGK
jgi:hypothetical protein